MKLIKTIFEIIGYGTGIGILLSLIITYIYAGFHNYTVTITMNSYGEYYVEILLFIVGLSGMIYTLKNRIKGEN